VFPDPHAHQTDVVIPSRSLGTEELAKISGVHHYEERMLCMLMLRLPRTNLVYVTSRPVAPTIIDYYLHRLPGAPVSYARRRLTLLSCRDTSKAPSPCGWTFLSTLATCPELVGHEKWQPGSVPASGRTYARGV
jgi:hypothetical protein